MTAFHSIEVTELYELNSESSALTVIDVREADEFKAVRTTFAKLHPLSKLSAGDLGNLAAVDRSEPIFVICRSGGRSQKACDLLVSAGFKNVTNVKGGMLAWDASGLPVVRS